MWQQLFTVPVLLAFVGAVIGGLCAINPKKNGWLLSIMFIIVGMVASAAMTDLIHRYTSWAWYHGLVGIGIGAIAGSVMDTINAVSPKYADKIITTVADSALNRIVGGSSSEDLSHRSHRNSHRDLNNRNVENRNE